MENLAQSFVVFAPPMENSRKMWKHWVRMNCWVSLSLWFGKEKWYKINPLLPPLSIFLMLHSLFLPFSSSLVFIYQCKKCLLLAFFFFLSVVFYLLLVFFICLFVFNVQMYLTIHFIPTEKVMFFIDERQMYLSKGDYFTVLISQH